jgi:choline dehydrogenase-like flavoprotein
MLLDATTVPAGGRIETDVCVVGAGPAGLTLARDWRDAPFRVLVLESGGSSPERASRSLQGGESVGHSYFPLASTRIRAVGGTSNHWYLHEGFRVRPLDPIDFEAREGVPHSGWPITKADLDPFYDRAHATLGVEPNVYDPVSQARERGPLLPLTDDDVVVAPFRVINGTGMPQHARDVEQAGNVTLMPHATVAEICTGEVPDRVSHLRVLRPDGVDFTVHAQHYVLASGGIENARLLLLSDRVQRGGLGNGHDLVGRFFMEHLGIRGGTLVPGDPDLLTRTGFYTTGTLRPGHVTVQGKLALNERVLRAERLLNATFFLEHMGRSRSTQAVRSFVILRRALTWRPLPGHLVQHARHALAGLGDVARTAVREQLGRGKEQEVIQLKAMAEQAPNPNSRVTLSPRRDRLGLRAARLDWRLTEQDLRSIVRTEELIDQQFRRSGIGWLRDKLAEGSQEGQISGQWHHLGTTRMHDDPRQGVVDRDGRVHGVGNLHVVGGSVFTTGGYANPTLTIVALAHRLADHLGGVLARPASAAARP